MMKQASFSWVVLGKMSFARPPSGVVAGRGTSLFILLGNLIHAIG